MTFGRNKSFKNDDMVALAIKCNLFGCYYNIGRFDITKETGAWYYRPSQYYVKEFGRQDPVAGDVAVANNFSGNFLDHLTLTPGGDMHATLKNKKDKYIPLNQSMSLREIGQRCILVDMFDEIIRLPESPRESLDGQDVLFNATDKHRRYFLRIDLVSGRNIIKGEVLPIPKKDHEGELIDEQIRAIGSESGNADMGLILRFYKYFGHKLPSGRRIFTPDPRPSNTRKKSW